MDLVAASAPRPRTYPAHGDANLLSRIDDILVTADMALTCPTATAHVSQDLTLKQTTGL